MTFVGAYGVHDQERVRQGEDAAFASTMSASGAS